MPARLRKVLIFLHRWLGTAFCTLFLIWFVSGMVLAYFDYPEISDRDRVAHAKSIDVSAIKFTSEQAYATLKLDGPPGSVTLLTYDGRPAYRFDDSLVYADTGEPQREFPKDLTLRIASRWIRQPPVAATLQIVTQPDQWTVSGEFGPLRPLDKYSWPNGEEVYVSEVSGDVVQHTTKGSRTGAWLGAIPHWLYFTPLRKNGRLWSRVVIWASGIGAVTAALGLIVGIWIILPATRVPYGGQKRWHAMLGLFFGFFACTWSFSGMLSMEPFSFSAGPRRTGGEIERALHSAGFKTWDRVLDEAAHGAKIIDFNALDGDSERVLDAVSNAVGREHIAETRWVTQYEAYYLDRHNAHPLPVWFVRLNDEHGSMFYIDPKSASIVEAYDSASRWNRWLYHGLHSLDFPWLYAHRPAWDVAVISLLLGGGWLSATSLILGWRVLRRTIF